LLRAFFTLTILAGAFACASTQEGAPSSSEKAASTPTSTLEVEAARGGASAEEEIDDEEALRLPRTFAEVPERFVYTCPAPPFSLEEPHVITAGEHRFRVLGNKMMREGPSLGDGPVFGVLGALKDASEETRANVKKAASAFAKRGVHFVVAAGDLGEDAELEPVMRMLGEELKVPVLMLSGNMEWARAFSNAWVAASADHPHLINLNWSWEVALGDGWHLLALPGYHNHRFLRSGACRYTDDDLAALEAAAARIAGEGGRVIFTSHGPPAGRTPEAIDVAYDDAGNVGDQRISDLLKETGVRFGLFSHILESGGRATADLKGKEPLTLPIKRPQASLYVNAGSASAFPWGLLDGKTSEGMAVVVKLSEAGATAEKLKLR
jgi:Icc-related predicted phosphoesterase